jgi:hypothetical protein
LVACTDTARRIAKMTLIAHAKQGTSSAHGVAHYPAAIRKTFILPHVGVVYFFRKAMALSISVLGEVGEWLSHPTLLDLSGTDTGGVQGGANQKSRWQSSKDGGRLQDVPPVRPPFDMLYISSSERPLMQLQFPSLAAFPLRI